MKFTTAIALTAFLGNAAFSNAQTANGNLDVCNTKNNDQLSAIDGDTYKKNESGCQKTCDRSHETGKIGNQVKIFCLIAKSEVGIEGTGNVDCFDPQYSVGECKKNVPVKIRYKYHNNNKFVALTIVHGDKESAKPTSWMAFDGDQVLEQGSNYQLPPNDGKIYTLDTIIPDTCEKVLVEMKSKVNAIKDSTLAPRKDENNWEHWTTDKCGISGYIHLCDEKCQQGQAAKNSPTASPTIAPTLAPGQTGPDPTPSDPSPSSPSKGGTKAPSAGKGTKQPTIGKGKGTPLPGRKLKNRKVARA